MRGPKRLIPPLALIGFFIAIGVAVWLAGSSWPSTGGGTPGPTLVNTSAPRTPSLQPSVASSPTGRPPGSTANVSIPPQAILLTFVLLCIALALVINAIVRGVKRRTVQQERERIAADVHDGIQQTVIVLQKQLERLGDRPELAEVLIPQLSTQSQALLQQVRAVAKGELFVTADLEKEIKQTAAELQAAGIPVLYEMLGKPWTLTELQMHEMTMIIKEGLCNVLKYGSSTTVAVLLLFNFSPDHLSIEMVDTGKGFDSRQVRHGMGLQNMQLRAQRIGGQVEIASETRKGTTIKLTIPRKY